MHGYDAGNLGTKVFHCTEPLSVFFLSWGLGAVQTLAFFLSSTRVRKSGSEFSTDGHKTLVRYKIDCVLYS